MHAVDHAARRDGVAVLEGQQVDVEDLVGHAPNLVAVETPGSLVTVGRVTTDTGIHRPTVPVSMPHCPICGVELQLGSSGTLDHWSCPAGHGLAMTLSESYERLQEDEIAHLWQLARGRGPGAAAQPVQRRAHGPRRGRLRRRRGRPRASPATAPDTGSVVVDVDVENEFIWFDAGELDELPVDLPDAPPSPEELAKPRPRSPPGSAPGSRPRPTSARAGSCPSGCTAGSPTTPARSTPWTGRPRRHRLLSAPPGPPPGPPQPG